MKTLCHATFFMSCLISSVSMASELILEDLQKVMTEASWEAGPMPFAPRDPRRLGQFGLIEGSKKGLSDKNFGLQNEERDPRRWGRIPQKWDWRRQGGISWLPAVRDQGYCGSCGEFAALGALESRLAISVVNPRYKVDLSEQFLISKTGSCIEGTTMKAVHEVLQENGTPDEGCFPYRSGFDGEDVDLGKVCESIKDRSFRVKTVDAVVGIDAIKRAILEGPVSTTMTIYEDFLFYKSGVYKHLAGEVLGGHAVSLVGYDEKEQAFIARNSWGPDWGEKGYFRIGYGEADIDIEAYAYKVEPKVVPIHMTKPAPFSAITGSVYLQPERVIWDAGLGAKISLKKMGEPKIASTYFSRLIEIPVPWNTRRFPDGAYEVSIASSKKQTAPWYSTIYVVNQPQPIIISIGIEDQDPSDVRGYVTMRATIGYKDVPLSELNIEISNAAGQKIETLKFHAPFDQVLAFWDSSSVSEGSYTVKALGRIGDLQQFKSEEIVLQIKPVDATFSATAVSETLGEATK